MPLSDKAKYKLDDAVATVSAEDYTFCGVAISPDVKEVQPFGNQTVVAEFVYNLLCAAAMIADGMYDNSYILDAMTKFQNQTKTIH